MIISMNKENFKNNFLKTNAYTFSVRKIKN